MVLDVERERPNNGMFVSRDQNCSRITAGNISRRALYQDGVLTAIEGWDLVYQEVGKSKVISEYIYSRIS